MLTEIKSLAIVLRSRVSALDECIYKLFNLNWVIVLCKKCDSTAHAHMDSINEKTMSQYFNLLKDVLDECNLKDNPSNIYNADESGIPFDFRTPNVVAEIGSKKVRYRHFWQKGTNHHHWVC